MSNLLGRGTRIAIGLASLLAASPGAIADARAWLSGGTAADAVLTLRSIDEADNAMRSLVRSSEIDWLPRASRLLEATNLSTGTDTTRSMVIAVLPAPHAESLPRIVTILPTRSSDQLIDAFDARRVDEATDLYSFSFAGREYHGRVLPDGHFAISADADTLVSLATDNSETDSPAPVRLELLGGGSIASLNALLTQAGADDLPTEAFAPILRQADGVIFDLTPDAQSLRADVLITPLDGGDLDGETGGDRPETLGPAPFPATDYVLLAHGRLDHPLFARWTKTLLADTLGLAEDDSKALQRASLLISAPETLFGSGGATVSLALEGEDPQSVQAAVRQALSRADGATLEAGASSRVGVRLDHLRFAAPTNANGERPNLGGGIGGMLLGGGRMDPGADQSIAGRMFTRNGRVYLTSATEGEKLDRLIAFSDRTTSVESTGPLNTWLDRLGREQDVRLALNIAPIVKWFAGPARITLPEEIAPVVGGLRTEEGVIRATVLVPAEVIKTLEQFRRVASSMERDR
ncbi:MAG: hypothetical protein NXI14_07565 [bacterium]|nr:hypothetical protein [bacterium]